MGMLNSPNPRVIFIFSLITQASFSEFVIATVTFIRLRISKHRSYPVFLWFWIVSWRNLTLSHKHVCAHPLPYLPFQVVLVLRHSVVLLLLVSQPLRSWFSPRKTSMDTILMLPKKQKKKNLGKTLEQTLCVFFLPLFTYFTIVSNSTTH